MYTKYTVTRGEREGERRKTQGKRRVISCDDCFERDLRAKSPWRARRQREWTCVTFNDYFFAAIHAVPVPPFIFFFLYVYMFLSFSYFCDTVDVNVRWKIEMQRGLRKKRTYKDEEKSNIYDLYYFIRV